jgi:hypothetical protein
LEKRLVLRATFASIPSVIFSALGNGCGNGFLKRPQPLHLGQPSMGIQGCRIVILALFFVKRILLLLLFFDELKRIMVKHMQQDSSESGHQLDFVERR